MPLLIFVGAGRGHVLLQQYFQNACFKSAQFVATYKVNNLPFAVIRLSARVVIEM